jgi:hypothetical protein
MPSKKDQKSQKSQKGEPCGPRPLNNSFQNGKPGSRSVLDGILIGIIVVQTAVPSRLTPTQPTMFVRFLRDRLRQHQHITDERVLRAYLEHNSWHITRAYKHVLRDREILANPQYDPDADTNDASGLRDQLRNLPFNSYLEQERRDAALYLRQQVNADRAEDEQINLSAVEAILLLHLANWDIARAVDEFTTHQGVLARLHVEFDSMRSNESINTFTTDDRQRQERQDQRLALLRLYYSRLPCATTGILSKLSSLSITGTL